MAKKRFQQTNFYEPKSGPAIAAGDKNDVEMDVIPLKMGHGLMWPTSFTT